MPIVVQSGSKQYIVSAGDKLVVDKINKEVGESVDLEVIYSFGADSTKEKSVSATISAHQRGEKIRVVKYKAKSNYHKQYGYRHAETVLVIGGLKPAKKTTAKKSVKKADTKEVVTEAKSKPAKKTTAKATTKKPAAKKTTAKTKKSTEAK